MDSSDTSTTGFHHVSSSPASSPISSPPCLPATPTTVVIHSPCAACKILRRRCADNCVLAPYFPPTEPLKFTTAHRVFGASNIIKLLQDLPENQRADAVSSMVYEAKARIRDPVYGCTGAVCQLQKQVDELQAQLARAKAELTNLQAQHGNLLALICMEMARTQQDCTPQSVDDALAASPCMFQSDADFLDEISQGLVWDEPHWL
ncbi:LOB domain-containing protein 1-like [Musa acuminata AAA Group]|uniref:LOB domain-containing protein 1 n=1 Tax=Musa acuminata AAA Group TaxID=214697 RepID=UPI0031DDB77A